MKNNYYLFLIVILLVSCSAALQKTAQTAIPETQITQPANTITPSPTSTSTQKPTSTNTPSPTVTITPTMILIPTEDLSFSGIGTCLPDNTLRQNGTVIQVIDGDTIDVRLDDGQIYPVRYIGMDAPERDQPFFTES